MTAPQAASLGRADIPAVVAVLGAAFRDYPMVRYVLGEDGDLDRFLGFFVTARILLGETVLGVRAPEGLLAAGLVSKVPGGPRPGTLRDLREATWDHLGCDARLRYERFGAAAGPLVPAVPHLHLNLIGVHPRARGRGLARIILDRVHEISAADPGSVGVSLSTEVEANVALYRHFGYDCVGSGVVDDSLTTWAMFRPDSVGIPGFMRGMALPIDEGAG